MSCFGGSDEQLYLLELLVETLKLPTEKFKDAACGDSDAADCRLVVKLKFLDFPTFEISQRDFYFASRARRDAAGCLNYSSGRACLFVKQPRDLVNEMRRAPLKIGIFAIGENFPIAETEVKLSGCMCNQISMASNDPDHLPPPYRINGRYHLTDPGENSWGTIDLDLRLCCFGKSVTTHYRLDEKSLCFKNDRVDDRYRVKRLLPVGFCADEAGKDTIKCGDSMLPSNLPNDESQPISVITKHPETEKIDGLGKKKNNGTKKNNNKKKK